MSAIKLFRLAGLWPTRCINGSFLPKIIGLWLVFSFFSHQLSAQAIHWNGSSSNSFTSGANWDGGVVPGASDSAYIPRMMPNYPVLNSTVTLQSVEVDSFASFVIGANGVLNLDGSADYGILNSGTMTNNGKIYIDNTLGDAIGNLNMFTNSGDIIIGATTPTVTGIYNDGTFVNTDCIGFIHLICNVGITTVGTQTFENGGGILENFDGNSNITDNTGIVVNLAGGMFDVGPGFPPTTFTGETWTGCLSTNWATPRNWMPHKVPVATDEVVIQAAPMATNQPTIMSGTTATARSVQMLAGSEIHINAGGTFLMNDPTSAGVTNRGLIENNGTFSINRCVTGALRQINATFENYGTVNLGTTSNIVGIPLDNDAGSSFLNDVGATMNIGFMTGHGIQNAGDFTNKALLNIAPALPPVSGSIVNSGTFLNDICAVASVGEFINNSSSFTNSGYLKINTTLAHVNSGSFTNDGFIQNFQNNSVPGLANNAIVAAPTSCPPCGEEGFNILDAASFGNFTIGTTWFKNAAMTMPGGTYDQGANSFLTDILPIGVHTLWFMATDDANGCAKSASIMMTVLEDLEPPMPLCQNLDLDLFGPAIAFTAEEIDNGSTDNCMVASLVLDITSFTCANLGPNTVVLTVTDDSGNTATCEAIVTISDNTTPTALCKNITVPLTGSTASITAAQIDNGSLDNCGFSLSAAPTSFTNSDIGPNTVVLTVTDDTGNPTTCASTVTIVDNTAPTAICKNISVPLAGSSASITAAEIDNGSSDNDAFTLSANPTTFTCATLGPRTVVLTVTDNSGNTATCVSTVTVLDQTAPTAICQDFTLQLVGATGTITPSQINNGSTDNCTITSLTLSKTTFNASNLGPNTVVLTVKDQSNNTSTCSAVVTVLAPISGMSIADKSVFEGSPSGTSACVFTVTRTNGSIPASVDWATSDGTATTAGNDYVAGSGTVSFAAGQTSKTFTVNVKKDNTVELNEDFLVNLSAPVNGNIADGSAIGTITNDDVVAIAMANVAATEGNSGLKNLNFTAVLAKPVDVAVTFNYTTSNGTATLANNDYVACTGCLVTVPAGALSAVFAIQAVGDTQFEANESINVATNNVSASGRAVTLANATRTATLTNDDAAGLVGHSGGIIENEFFEKLPVEKQPGLVFPNPATNELFVQLDGKSEFILRQTDVFGKLISTHKVAASSGPTQLDVSQFSSGIYFLSIENLTDSSAEKQVIRWVKAD